MTRQLAIARFRLAAAALAVVAALVATTRSVSAHTGEEASAGHVIIEVATWTIGIAVVIAVLVVVARLRVQWLERRRS